MFIISQATDEGHLGGGLLRAKGAFQKIPMPKAPPNGTKRMKNNPYRDAAAGGGCGATRRRDE